MVNRGKILILGSRGRLGAALVKKYSPTHDVIPFGRSDLDLSWEPARIEASLRDVSFDVLINAAGNTAVDSSESHEEEATIANAIGPEAIARVCHSRGARLVQISTDYVFGGDVDRPLKEDDPTHPVQVYGATKLKGEQLVLRACPSAIVARVSWLFGLEKPSFPDRMIELALKGGRVAAVADKWSSPTSAEDLVGWLQFILNDLPDFRGLLHLCNGGSCTWQEYGQHAVDVARELGLPILSQTVEPIQMSDVKEFAATRPRYTVMDTSRFQRATGITPRDWRESLSEYIRTRYSRLS